MLYEKKKIGELGFSFTLSLKMFGLRMTIARFSDDMKPHKGWIL